MDYGLLDKCSHCIDYPEDCGIYVMMALWEKKNVNFLEKMKKTYNEFLAAIDIIDEESFNELMKYLPDVDIEFDFNDLYSDEYDDLDRIAKSIINVVLNDFDTVYISFIDTNNYSIELEDVQSLEDLEKIKGLLSNWDIINYNTIVSEIEEQQEQYFFDNKIDKLKNILELLPEEEIDKLLNQYDKK